jgi:capsular exopolysaccharide synthesis family protein
MSKFFNESTKAQRLEGAAAAAAPAKPDIHQLVGSLKQMLEASGASAPAAEDGLTSILQPFQESRGALQLAQGRLEKCRVIRLPRTGEKSFLVVQYNPPMQAAVEAYRTLRTRLAKQQAANGARSLVVSSPMPGEGKTLTAFNLCLCYAQIPDLPVLAVDADLRTRGFSRLLGETESPGLAAILEGTSEPAGVVLRTDIPDLYVLPAGQSVQSPAELFSSEHWKEFMGWASETFRLVIIDSPPALAVSDFDLILAHCESAMMVVRARKSAAEALTQALGQIEPGKLAGVVFNAADEISHGGYYSQQ